MTKLYCKGKCTVYVKFTESKPLRIEVLNDAGKVYYFRELNNNYNQIKFNICHAGHYKINPDCVIEKIVPIEIEKLNVVLPPFDRNKEKPVVFKYNPDLLTSPARIFTDKGIIETGRHFKSYPFPIRLFILCHEIGHFYYKGEENADLYACKLYVDNGYNKTNALYALTKVLRNSLNNEKRVKALFNILNS